MKIVRRIFWAAGCVQNATKHAAGLVITLRDITADGGRARLNIIQPDNFAATTAVTFVYLKFSPGRKQLRFQSIPPVCLVLVAGVLLFSGCGKAKKAASETPAPAPETAKQTAPDNLSVPAPAPGTAPAVVAAPNGEPDLGELNRNLIRWIVRNQRRPANFEDFAATAGVVIPPAPAGKKYVIAKNMHIQLVRQ
jgi:hypothetical protein